MAKRNKKAQKNVSVNNMVETTETVEISMSRDVAEELKRRFIGETTESGNENMPEMNLEELEEQIRVAEQMKELHEMKNNLHVDKNVRRLIKMATRNQPALMAMGVKLVNDAMTEDEMGTFGSMETEARGLYVFDKLGVTEETTNEEAMEFMLRVTAEALFNQPEDVTRLITNPEATVVGKVLAWMLTGDIKITKELKAFFAKFATNSEAVSLMDEMKEFEEFRNMDILKDPETRKHFIDMLVTAKLAGVELADLMGEDANKFKAPKDVVEPVATEAVMLPYDENFITSAVDTATIEAIFSEVSEPEPVAVVTPVTSRITKSSSVVKQTAEKVSQLIGFGF